MVEAGQKRLKRAQLSHVKLLLGDMQAAPIGDESADFVLSQQSLQYATDPPSSAFARRRGSCDQAVAFWW